MIKRSVQQMESTSIEGEGIKGVSMKLLVGRDDSAPTFAMRHFSVEHGGYTPKHQHPWEHEVMILSGTGEVECAGKVLPISEGDGLYIPSEDLHQFRNTGDKPLEFLCIVPVESDCGEVVPGS
ncbi:MAG: cupin domain-containing protein [Phycisphaerae bacterium]|jgi:quercetin dioxygenase-like cupin family protein|nr:cupin domain-containing protein [Phycisphaerae bacterium]